MAIDLKMFRTSVIILGALGAAALVVQLMNTSVIYKGMQAWASEQTRIDATSAALKDARSVCGNAKISAEQAIAACSIVIRSDAKAAWAYTIRGIRYASIVDLDHVDLDRAMADINTAIDIDPALAPAYVARASADGMRGEWRRAIADYSKAVELDPAPALTYSNRAVAYIQNQLLPRLVGWLTKGVEIAPISLGRVSEPR
jgi:tetratricopeptide (TPR) repeat protein